MSSFITVDGTLATLCIENHVKTSIIHRHLILVKKQQNYDLPENSTIIPSFKTTTAGLLVTIIS